MIPRCATCGSPRVSPLATAATTVLAGSYRCFACSTDHWPLLFPATPPDHPLTPETIGPGPQPYSPASVRLVPR